MGKGDKLMDYGEFRDRLAELVQERADDANVVGSLECDVKEGGVDILFGRCVESMRGGLAKSNLLIQRR